MATEEYMTSQTYSATIGGVVYNVTAAVGGQMDYSTDKTFSGSVNVVGDLTVGDSVISDNIDPATVGGTLTVSGDLDVTGDIEINSAKTLIRGSGSPEGVVTAPVGCIYERTNGGTSTSIYIKESGSGNTGWVALGRVGACVVLTAAADDATPTVAGATHLLLPANTGATAITQLDNAIAGQQVTLVCTNTTNASTITDGGNFALSANWTPNVDDTLTVFTADGTAWREISRSAN